MNENEFFSIEFLKDYFLGLLNREEEKKLLAACNNFPELAKELKVLRLALEINKNINRIQHNTETRKAVWEAIKNIE